jgi:hypothetical protein
MKVSSHSTLIIKIEYLTTFKSRKEVENLELELVLAVEGPTRTKQTIELKMENRQDTVNDLEAVEVEVGLGLSSLGKVGKERFF